MISFSSAVKITNRYSKNQNIFVGFSEMLKKIMIKNRFCKELLSTSDRRGVLIAFREASNHKVINQYVDDGGRFIVLIFHMSYVS